MSVKCYKIETVIPCCLLKSAPSSSTVTGLTTEKIHQINIFKKSQQQQKKIIPASLLIVSMGIYSSLWEASESDACNLQITFNLKNRFFALELLFSFHLLVSWNISA